MHNIRVLSTLSFDKNCLNADFLIKLPEHFQERGRFVGTSWCEKSARNMRHQKTRGVANKRLFPRRFYWPCLLVVPLLLTILFASNLSPLSSPISHDEYFFHNRCSFTANMSNGSSKRATCFKSFARRQDSAGACHCACACAASTWGCYDTGACTAGATSATGCHGAAGACHYNATSATGCHDQALGKFNCAKTSATGCRPAKAGFYSTTNFSLKQCFSLQQCFSLRQCSFSLKQWHFSLQQWVFVDVGGK